MASYPPQSYSYSASDVENGYSYYQRGPLPVPNQEPELYAQHDPYYQGPLGSEPEHHSPIQPTYDALPFQDLQRHTLTDEPLQPPPGSDPHAPLLHQPSNSFPGGFVAPEEPSLVRYGAIPQRQPRRYKTIKRVELYQGNLVLDCPVPEKLLAMSPNRTDREMTHMRYTACTCDPDDFKSERYGLRQILYDPPRKTELFIVLTMYNEDEKLFCRSLQGVIKNISHLCTRNRSKTWGAEGWKKVVVCVVSDGRKKINSRTLSVLAAMGVYQEGVAKNVVNGKPVTAHIYEYTTQIAIDPDLRQQGSEKGVVPCQILFCLKEKNQKKINSHRWFFNAFGPILSPNVCVLLDVGTMPGPTSIYHLWKAFDVNSSIGGACGEIVALKGKYMANLLNPLVASQNFEYKMSNILDKPTESVFGYISVLPGAFSAYRYVALQNDVKGHGPLSEYFKGETLHTDPETDLWTKNMYLAEDRILCWELVAKRESNWLLHYVKSAYATTDVPDRLPELILQRRRWLNGSFFAAIHSIVHFGYLYRSRHTLARKAWLHVELLYNVFNMVFAWFALGNWFIAFEILTKSLGDDSFHMPWAKYVNIVLHYVYLALLVMCFLLAMGNRPQGSNKTFTFAVVFFAILTCYMTFAAIFLAVKGTINVTKAAEDDNGHVKASDIFGNSIFRNIVVSILSTYGLYVLSSLMFFDPWHMLTSFLQYILLAPSYINVIATCTTFRGAPRRVLLRVGSIMLKSLCSKGDTKVETELGVVKTGADNAVEVAVPTSSKDIDDLYDDAWAVLQHKAPKVKEVVDAETRVQDSYKNIRTNVVMFWAISNGALVASILSTGAGSNISSSGSDAKVNGYMAFLLYSVAGLALIRFIGATVYIIGWLFTG